MDHYGLAQLAIRDLEPLLAAAGEVGRPARQRRFRGGRDAPGNRPWIYISGEMEVSFTRSRPLSRHEGALLRPYGEALAELQGLPAPVARAAADDVLIRAIAAQVGGEHHETVEGALRFLFKCAVSTYEGRPVNLSVLIELNRSEPEPAIANLEAYREYDWYAVLGSSVETGIVVDQNGCVIRIADTSQEGQGGDEEALRPEALQHVCDWTLGGDRVSMSLTRTRELLIFKNGSLLYIHREGAWRGIPSDVALKIGWGVKINGPVKRATVASLLDSSIAHHGACIAIVGRGYKKAFFANEAVREEDLWPDNVRARLQPGEKFQDLSRRQRIELLSMDGATVLDHTGKILTAGAIVAVPGGSRGGGRLAAARALAAYGAAFKVSQDGPVSLFGVSSDAEPEMRLAFA